MPNEKYDNFFTGLENTMPYFKCDAFGDAGSGKTYTEALIAAGLHKYIGSKKPIVIFDTEKTSKFLRPFFRDRNIEVLLKESRTLSDLTATMDYCDQGNADILIIDSITHVWEGYLNAYQQQKNRKFLQFQDWGYLKPLWKREYSDRLVMGKYHILFTGREGNIYEYIENDAGQKELVKSGVKMKSEADTAYEPDLVLHMERHEEILTKDKKIWRQATVIKDRSTLLDGKVMINPTFEDFRPVLDFLLSDVRIKEDTKSYDDAPLFDSEDENREARQHRKETLEEIWGVFDKLGLGTGAADKKRKVTILERIFMTTSKSRIEGMTLDQLLDGLARLQEDDEVKQLMQEAA